MQVRDRATIAIHILQSMGVEGDDGPDHSNSDTGVEESKSNSAPQPSLHNSYTHDTDDNTIPFTDSHNHATSEAHLLLDPLPMSFTALERAVNIYAHSLGSSEGQPMMFSSLPVIEVEATPNTQTASASASTYHSTSGGVTGVSDPSVSSKATGTGANGGAPSSMSSGVDDPAAELYKVCYTSSGCSMLYS